MPRLVLAAAALLTFAGCGNARTIAPDVTRPEDPRGEVVVELPQARLGFVAPANWRPLEARDALVGGIESRRATLAIWRYPRTEPLPATEAQLERVRDLLVERVQERDPTFRLGAARITRRAGAPAVELTGAGSIAGRPVRLRSSHVYAEGAEIVVDAYAPPGDFARLDGPVFVHALRSLRLSPVGG